MVRTHRHIVTTFNNPGSLVVSNDTERRGLNVDSYILGLRCHRDQIGGRPQIGHGIIHRRIIQLA